VAEIVVVSSVERILTLSVIILVIQGFEIVDNTVKSRHNKNNSLKCFFLNVVD